MERVKRQLREWEKIFVNHMLSDKGIVTRLCNELLHSNNKKTIQFRMSKGPE